MRTQNTGAVTHTKKGKFEKINQEEELRNNSKIKKINRNDYNTVFKWVKTDDKDDFQLSL